MRTVTYAFLLLCLIVKSSSQPVPLHQETQESFVAGAVRVKRQAGYVYDKPSVSFNLPTGAPAVSTQAPSVDRTQAQMMYYAYPAPAAGGNEVVIGGGDSSRTSAGGTATASADTTSDGYKYGAQNTAPAEVQSTDSSQSSTGSTQSPSAGTSGYGYNAPSAGTANGYQSSSVDSIQTINAGSSQTASSSGSASGYAYNPPTKTQADSGARQAVDVSTNAPKYLPPTSDGGYSNDITSGSISTGSGTIGSVFSSSAADSPPLDQYLPPLRTPNPPASLAPTGPSVNVGAASIGSVPSSNYIPPERPSSQLLTKNVTPRPFSPAPPPNLPRNYIPPDRAPSPLPINNDSPRPSSPAPAPPSTGYLPPSVLYQAPVQNFPSTPASAYLPPTL